MDKYLLFKTKILRGFEPESALDGRDVFDNKKL